MSQVEKQPPTNSKEFNHYYKNVEHLEYVDVYRIIKLFAIDDPCLQHALKKLLVAGGRGAKDDIKDITEVIASCKRYLEMKEEDAKKTVVFDNTLVTPAPSYSAGPFR